MRKARPRQAGLALVNDLSEATFADFLQKLAKKSKSSIDGIADVTRQQLLNVCTALESQVVRALPVAVDLHREEDLHPAKDAIVTLHGAAVLGLELLTRSQQQPPEQLLNAAIMLHDGVLITNLHPELEKQQVAMQDAVMLLCCTWWERGLPGNDFLVARTIPYVLLRAIQSLEQSRTSMVRMCYMIRDALELLDFEDETIRDTKRLLLLAAMHPSFLREAEGRRFIAGLFKLDAQMTRELSAIIRNQIPCGQNFALEAYGEILFRAWRDTVGPCAVEVESEIQALMQSAILASTPAIASALRKVLDGLHGQKSLEKRVNPTLLRLYCPILPRAFAAANSEVRRNAVNLLVAAFPIIDPEESADETNVRLTQQLGFLIDSLTDQCPAVREAAVEGCCRCLLYFWEIIPAATSAKMIGDITGKLAFDGSSRAVRLSVLRSLRKLVDSQHAQPVLKKALPGISGLLQDSDAGVREALVDLLVAVSRSRGLAFWGVVPPEDLLEAIVSDRAPTVACKISRMLLPSFFPNAQEGSARVGAVLRSKPEAGLSFCRNMVARFYPKHPGADRSQANTSTEFTASVPLEQILQLASDLVAHLLATVSRLGSDAIQTAQQNQPTSDARASSRGRGKAGMKRLRKKKAALPRGSDEERDHVEQQANVDTGNNGVAVRSSRAEDGDDMVLQSEPMETEEGWLAILEGLATIVNGVGAAVLYAEECNTQDVEAALPADSLIQLMQAAEERLRKPKAVKLVLQIVASVYFTPGAQCVRAVLFKRLAEGMLPGYTASFNGEMMELDDHNGPTGHNAGLLSEVIQTLASGSNAPKLVAMLSAALGVRQPLPLRKPVAKKAAQGATGRGHGLDALEKMLSGHDGLGLDRHDRGGETCEDETTCEGCKCSQPAHNMLICDGCDVPCHTNCLRPALQDIPTDAWFCWRCESQLQQVKLSAAAAGRCVCLLLQHDGGREVLLGHPDCDAMIEAMRRLAIMDGEEIHAMAQAGGTEIDRTRTDDALTEDNSTVLLGDPWGSLARYCRAAVHRAMARLSQDCNAASKTPSVRPTPRPTPMSLRHNRRGRSSGAVVSGSTQEELMAASTLERAHSDSAVQPTGFIEIVPVLEFAMQACSQLSELVLEEPCVAAQMAALQYSLGLLCVLHFVHETELLSMSGQYISAVSGLCNAQTVLAHTVLSALNERGGASVQPPASLTGILVVLPLLAQQMAEAYRRSPDMEVMGVAGDGGISLVTSVTTPRIGKNIGGTPILQQKAAWLDGRCREGASPSSMPDECTEEVVAPEVALNQLLASLMVLLCHPAVEPLLKGRVRSSVAFLMTELITTTRKVSSNDWLHTLCKLTGEALACHPMAAEELQNALRLEDSQVDGSGERIAHDEVEVGGEVNEVAGAGGTARAVRRCVRGGKVSATPPAAKALQAAVSQLSVLLERESPALGILAALLVRVSKAHQVQGRAMLLLARMVSMSLTSAAMQQQQNTEHTDTHGMAALGAAALFAICRAAFPDAEALGVVAAENGRQTFKRGSRRAATAFDISKWQASAAREESDAAFKGMEALRCIIQQQQQLHGGVPAGEVESGDRGPEVPTCLRYAWMLTRQLVTGFTPKAGVPGKCT